MVAQGQWSSRTIGEPVEHVNPDATGWVPKAGPDVLREVPDLAPLIRESLARILPSAVRGARLRLTWRAVASLALLVALAVAVGAVVVLRGRPHLVAADQPLPVTSGFSARPGLMPPDGPGGSGLVVEVVGRVRHPGVITLPAGSRVIDALKAVGGALPGVDTSALDLARKLTDGEQVRVGLHGAGLAAPGASAGPVDLNSATAAQLDGLPGVGPVLSGRIVAWRESHGPFTDVSQLKQIGGLSGKKYDAVATLVTVSP